MDKLVVDKFLVDKLVDKLKLDKFFVDKLFADKFFAEKFLANKFKLEQFWLIQANWLRLNQARFNRNQARLTRLGTSQRSMAGKLGSQGLKGRIHSCLDTEIQIALTHARRRTQGGRGWGQPSRRRRQHRWLRFNRLGGRVHSWADVCREINDARRLQPKP